MEREPAPRRPAALVLWAGLTALLTVAAFAARGGGSDEGEQPIYEWSSAVTSIVFYSVILAVAVGIASLFPSVREALGFRRFRGRSVWQAAGVVLVALVVAAALEPVLHAGEEQGLAPQEWRPDDLAPFLVNAILISTWGPFVEEVFYRGLGVTAVGWLGPAVAVVGTAVAFALVHGQLVAVPPLVVFGFGLAWVRLRSGSVWPCFIAHGSYNAIAIAISLAAAQ